MVPGYLSMKSLRNANESMIKSGYCLDETRTCPKLVLEARVNHGSHVTATSTRLATKVDPALPEVMFSSVTSDSDNPFFFSTWARNHSDTDPWLTATVLPLRSCTVWMVFLARIPSPPTEASMGRISTAGTPCDWARANAS